MKMILPAARIATMRTMGIDCNRTCGNPYIVQH
jgi:hypothetical protein